MRVLARPAFRNRRSNPYNALIYGAMREQGVRISEYHGPRAWLSRERHEIFHVHWPESAFNHGLVGAWLTSRSLLHTMDRLRARGTRCVWTAHNLAAHERRFPRAEAHAWRAFTGRLDGFVSLTEPGMTAVREHFPALRDVPGFVVAHPHFRGAYPDHVTRAQARDRLAIPQDAQVIAYLGRILDYKNVPELVRVFVQLPAREARLLIAGEPRTPRQAGDVLAAASGDARVRCVFEHIASDAIQLYLRAANLVVLPYREIFNSGSALLALSFDRPVLMPRSAAACDLQASAGPAWVEAYDVLTPALLMAAVERAARLPEDSPCSLLAVRDPARIAREHVTAYRSLLAARGGS